MSYKVTLIKKTSAHNNVRTNTVDGYCESLPEIGKKFMLLGEGLEFGTRMVMTSFVKEVERVPSWEDLILIKFKTENSTYELEAVKQ